MSAPGMFPVMGARGGGTVAYVPWAIVAAHERQALKNHHQSLTRLAERGGLSAGELAAVLRDEEHRQRTDVEAWTAIFHAIAGHAAGLAAADALAQACIQMNCNIHCAVCGKGLGFSEMTATAAELADAVAQIEHDKGCALTAYLAARKVP